MNLSFRGGLLVINIVIICFFQKKELLTFVISSHLFLFALDVFSYEFEKRLKSIRRPLLALSINFFRIVFCIAFLLPQIIFSNSENKTYIINFFLIYFILLIINLINKKKQLNKS